MKKLLKSVLMAGAVLLAFTACNSNKFAIAAHIDNLEDQEVYLTVEGKDGVVYLDTTRSKKGEFSFEGKMDMNDFRFITFQNLAGQIELYLDNSKVKITGAYPYLDSVKVTGSPAMDGYIRMKQEDVDNEKYIREKVDAFQQANKNNDTTTMNQIISQVQDYRRAYAKKLFDQANENPQDIVSLMVLSKYIPFLAPDDIADYYEKVPESIKTDFRIEGFDRFLREGVIKVARGAQAPHFNVAKVGGAAADSVTNETIKGKVTALYISVEGMPENQPMYRALKQAKEKGAEVYVALMFMDENNIPKTLSEVKEKGVEDFTVVHSQPILAQDFLAGSPRAFFIGKDGKILGVALDSAAVEKVVKTKL